MKNTQRLFGRAVLWLGIGFISLSSQLWAANDGPYVYEESGQRQAIWICDGVKNTRLVSLVTPQTIDYCGMKATLWEPVSRQLSDNKFDEIEFNGDFNVVAVSDIHGQYDLFIHLLQSNGIINQQKRWNFGEGHFVITGDVFDRGTQVTEALWFLYDLQRQAQQAGGRVHLLLGNHEVMVLNGDLRYLHFKYADTERVLEKSYQALFAKGSVLGDWLRSRPVLVKVNGMLFAHGGFHPQLATEAHSITEINQVFKDSLVKEEGSDERQGFADFLHTSLGPIWYRGYFTGERADGDQIDQLLKHFGVSNIIVGHTTQEQIESRYGGKIIAIDSDMKTGQSGELLLWQKGVFCRGNLLGECVKLF